MIADNNVITRNVESLNRKRGHRCNYFIRQKILKALVSIVNGFGSSPESKISEPPAFPATRDMASELSERLLETAFGHLRLIQVA